MMCFHIYLISHLYVYTVDNFNMGSTTGATCGVQITYSYDAHKFTPLRVLMGFVLRNLKFSVQFCESLFVFLYLYFICRLYCLPFDLRFLNFEYQFAILVCSYSFGYVSGLTCGNIYSKSTRIMNTLELLYMIFNLRNTIATTN